MAGPSLYKPRRTVGPTNGSEVDTSVSYLLGGVVVLLLLLVTFIGMVGVGSSKSAPTPAEEDARPRVRGADIGANPAPTP